MDSQAELVLINYHDLHIEWAVSKLTTLCLEQKGLKYISTAQTTCNRFFSEHISQWVHTEISTSICLYLLKFAITSHHQKYVSVNVNAVLINMAFTEYEILIVFMLSLFRAVAIHSLLKNATLLSWMKIFRFLIDS